MTDKFSNWFIYKILEVWMKTSHNFIYFYGTNFKFFLNGRFLYDNSSFWFLIWNIRFLKVWEKHGGGKRMWPNQVPNHAHKSWNKKRVKTGPQSYSTWHSPSHSFIYFHFPTNKLYIALSLQTQTQTQTQTLFHFILSTVPHDLPPPKYL
jgi:hypothetical protein